MSNWKKNLLKENNVYEIYLLWLIKKGNKLKSVS